MIDMGNKVIGTEVGAIAAIESAIIIIAPVIGYR